MAIHEHDVRSPQFNRTDGRFNRNLHDDEVPLGDLLRRFGQDAGNLVKQEIALAKIEMRESMKGYARDAGRLGVAVGVAWFGAMALVAFLVIGLGALINNYWLSALIWTVVLLGAAAVLAKGALAHLKRNSLAPEETVETLKEDQRWAKQEAQEFKQRLKA
ncbi:MAG TPA: phage holin family protein [Longimicrobiales bacterium]